MGCCGQVLVGPPQQSDTPLQLLAVPFWWHYCPLCRDSSNGHCFTSFLQPGTLMYASVCLPRSDTPSVGRSARLNFLTHSPFWTLVVEVLTRNFDFQWSSKNPVTQVKRETCLFWASGLPTSICIGLKIKNSSSAGVQLCSIDLNGAALPHNKRASVHSPLLLQTTEVNTKDK